MIAPQRTVLFQTVKVGVQTNYWYAKMYIKMCLAFLLLPPPEHKPELMVRLFRKPIIIIHIG